MMCWKVTEKIFLISMKIVWFMVGEEIEITITAPRHLHLNSAKTFEALLDAESMEKELKTQNCMKFTTSMKFN